MSPPGAPFRSYLYVPGSDPRRIEKALSSEADAVIIDLEDAVVPDRKDEARKNVAGVLEREPTKPVFVRVNAPGSALCERDVEAVARPGLAGLRLPKTESPEEVRRIAERLEELGCGAVIQCLIESALGLEMAFELARSHPRVTALAPGEADLAADLGVSGEEGLLYARSRVVAASRAAGLQGPVQSVYTDVRDLEGLRRSTEAGKRLGFFGRSAIHPAQVPVINEIFTPTGEEVARARELLQAMERAAASGTGAFALEDGRFVDEAVVRAARLTLAVARGTNGEDG
ncbi:Citrate lyase subunit beta [Rubrobacter xylanophilus DSM 9941]|uniref:HpcH/HpaI aldolase/citrate lyase family protein n=1 Tax=Rubrobacter xylanophilus TaxID=49319 RepID=UPI001C63E4EA|nr:CoA ester lyase [Rubrobacter xylanophilus]QYJ16591.1 Citrate lyase subunit beta [Rubrobacter xylanophilus DSM 9941]